MPGFDSGRRRSWEGRGLRAGAAVYRGCICLWVAQRSTGLYLLLGGRSGVPGLYLPLGGAAVYGVVLAFVWAQRTGFVLAFGWRSGLPLRSSTATRRL
jgi:hypothetical protein